jgi:hypothetical protein
MGWRVYIKKMLTVLISNWSIVVSPQPAIILSGMIHHMSHTSNRL